MSVGRICSRVVATATAEETVRVAARRMVRNDVGALVVVQGGTRRPVGLLTDRDIAVRCVAADLDPDQTPIGSVMSAPPQAVDADTPIEEAVERMAGSAIRRLVVTGEDGRLEGLVSLDDVLRLRVGEAGSIGRLLEAQRASVPA